MTLLPLIPIFIAVSVVSVARASGCSESELAKCMKDLNVVSQNEDLAFGMTEEEIEKICGLIQTAKKCVNDFTNRCLDSMQIEVYKAVTSGAQKLLSDICTRGSPFQRKYLEHAGCYKNVTGEYKVCTEKYMKEQEAVKHQDMDTEDRVRKSCCLFSFYKECARTAVLTKCSEEAAEMSDNILVMVGGPLVHVQCSSYKHDSPYCSSASILHFSIFILVFTLGLILAKPELTPI